MAIFTALATTLLAGTFLAGTIAVPIVAGAIGLAASIGLGYIQKALAGSPAQPSQQGFSVQGKLQSGGAVPRSFVVGTGATAGSLVYANTWGNDGETPNAYFTQVIALSDLPSGDLRQVWVSGELVTLNAPPHPEFGHPIAEYVKDGKDHLWVKYYDGTQTAADAFLTSKVSSTERPYTSDRVGYGITYLIVTALVNDKLFSGFPQVKCAIDGTKFYDPSKDSSVGGSGSHRYSDPSTWGGDGDHLPVVQIYNLLRGIRYGGSWLYGLQAMGAAGLPPVNWISQIAKCREAITGESGPEPTYRAGGQINVDAQTATAIEALLSACQGRLSEVGGFYKIHVGEPDSPSFAWTDDDLLSTEVQELKPFFALADSVNGIQAKYPDPAQGWNETTAPAYLRSDLEAIDGGRRLMANPSLDFVPYAAQVQRLQKSAIEEAQRARTHVLPFPPAFWLVEPGDVGQWTSLRNGYDAKLFRVDSIVDRSNLDVSMAVTEVNPADYDWAHDIDFRPVYPGVTVFPRPAPQGMLDFAVEQYTITSDDGLSKRPAIRLTFDKNLPGIAGVAYQVRLASDHTQVVYRGQVDYELSDGAVIISQNLLPSTDYEVQARYLPTAPRDVLPSDWIAVTTPDARLSLYDVEGALKYQTTTLLDQRFADVDKRIARVATVVQQALSRTYLDKTVVRRDVTAASDRATAGIAEVMTVATDTQSALASYELTVAAQFDTVNAHVSEALFAASSAEAAVADLETTVEAQIGAINGALGPLSATVTEHSSAIALLDGYAAGKWAVLITVDGAGRKSVAGITLFTDSGDASAFSVNANQFFITFPDAAGGDPVPVFTIANVGGVAKSVLRGDMFVDGGILTRMIAAGQITAVTIQAGAVNTTQLAINGVDINNIIAGAVTNTQKFDVGAAIGDGALVASNGVNIQSGKATMRYCSQWNAVHAGVTTTENLYVRFYVDGTLVRQFVAATTPTISGTSIQSNWVCYDVINYEWTISGLSAGAHTFAVRIGGTSAQVTDGQLYVTDFRR